MNPLLDIINAQKDGTKLTEQEFLQKLSKTPRMSAEKIPNPLTGQTTPDDTTPLVYSPEARKEIASWKESFKPSTVDAPTQAVKDVVPTEAPQGLMNPMGGDQGLSANNKMALANTALQSTGADKSAAGGIASGALSGAMLTPGNPLIGAAIGGAVAGISGGLKAKAEKKERRRKANAEAQQNISNIEQSIGQNRSVGIGNILTAFQNALVRR